jgi:hypothetical protein
MVGRQMNWTRWLVSFSLTGFGLGALKFIPLIGVFVAFQLEWLPCGVIWSSSGLGVMTRFVQGSAQQSLPTAFPPFPSVAPTVRFRLRCMAFVFPKYRQKGSESASDYRQERM